MMKLVEQNPQRIKLLLPAERLTDSPLTEREIQSIAKVSHTRLLQMKDCLSIYNLDKNVEVTFKKTKIVDHVHSVEVLEIKQKDLFVNKGLLTYKPGS